MNEVLRGIVGVAQRRMSLIIRRKGSYTGYTGSWNGMEHGMFQTKASMAGPQRIAKQAGGSLNCLEMIISIKRNW